MVKKKKNIKPITPLLIPTATAYEQNVHKHMIAILIIQVIEMYIKN